MLLNDVLLYVEAVLEEIRRWVAVCPVIGASPLSCERWSVGEDCRSLLVIPRLVQMCGTDFGLIQNERGVL